MYAEVVPETGGRFDAVLTYAVPEALRGRAAVGAQALVPLGRRIVPGFIVGLLEAPPPGIGEVKELAQVPEAGLALPPGVIALARWLAARYVCTLSQALGLALPSGLRARVRRLVALGDAEAAQRARRERPEYGCLLDALAGGKEISASRLMRKCAQVDAGAALEWLRSRKAVHARDEIVGAVAGARQDPLLEAAVSGEVLAERAQALAKRAPARARALRAAARMKRPVRAAALAKRARCARGAVTALVESGLLRPHEPPAGAKPKRRPQTLTLHQGTALHDIVKAVDAGRPEVFLLRGGPGSARFAVWIAAVERAVALGKQALVLLPEIALAQRQVAALGQRFGDRLAVAHSGAAAGQRRQEWERIDRGEAALVAGARSAAFAPCRNLGLIVVEDEHDESYKQEDAPRMNARDAAVERGRLEGCPVVLSSASPSLESAYAARQGAYRALPLQAGRNPAVTVVDTRGTARTTCSARLVMAVKRAVDGGGKALLLLPRRGMATALVCAECGRVEKCPHCDVSMTYHLPGRRVVCHHCGLSRQPPDVCPQCGGRRLVLRGAGTQRVEEDIKRAVPGARVALLDRALRGGGAEKANVIISTGLVEETRGISKVRLVGVISADTWLSRPDFRAGERTYQFLAQAAARAAEAGGKGHLVIQTGQPEHYAIRAVARGDEEGFYQEELEARGEHGYPPFGVMAAVLVSARSGQRAQAVAGAIAGALANNESVTVLGPAPAPIARLKGRDRWQVLALAKAHEGLLHAVRRALQEAGKRPGDVSVQVDVDPVSLV